MTQEVLAHLDRPLLDAGGLDLDGAAKVTYVLRQRFRYDYDGPAYDLDHRLVVVPRARHGSLRRRLHGVEVSVREARIRNRRDAYGNVVVHVGIDVVPATIEFALTAVVERTGPRVDAVLPLSALTDQRLLRPTRLTAADEAIRDLAADLRAGSSDRLEFAERSCTLVQAVIKYEFGVTDYATTAAEAFALGRGVCQDHAHLALAICRTAGIPARYISGHLLGDSGTHAWIEVVVPDGEHARAVAFDPCNGCRAGSRHLPVAAGRDYADVAPTSGRFAGTGQGRLTAHKQLGVTVAA
jgi:transglutaminase-like putative cysteine protease